MLMDLICIALIALTALFYARRGFALTVTSMFQWLACIVCGLLFCDDIKDFLITHTGIDDRMTLKITEKISENITGSTIYQSIPKLFTDYVDTTAISAAEEVAQSITAIILTLLAFLIIVILIKIACSFFLLLFSREYHTGLIALADSLGGMALGVAMGFFYVMLFFCALAFLMQVFPEGLAAAINSSLDRSFFSGTLYDTNPVLKLLSGLLTEF